MEELGSGADRNAPRKPLPEDAELLGQVRSFRVLWSREQQSLLVQVADYHPGILRLSKADLQRALEHLTTNGSTGAGDDEPLSADDAAESACSQTDAADQSAEAPVQSP